MKKSRAVQISLVTSLAAAAMAAGCGSYGRRQGWQTCVDRVNDTAVDRRYCDDEWSQSRPSGYVPHYHWYYYPHGYFWNAPLIGAAVPPGGSYSRAPLGSVPIAHGSASTARGGFGSTAAGRASGG